MTNLTERELAKLWAQWNGQRGTDNQIDKILKVLNTASLIRMLTQRGVKV